MLKNIQKEEHLEKIESVEQDLEENEPIEYDEPEKQIQASKPKPKKVLNENHRKAVAINLKKDEKH